MTKEEYQLLFEANLTKIRDVIFSMDFDQNRTLNHKHYEAVVVIGTDTLDRIDQLVSKCREYVAGLRDAIGKETNQ